MDLFRWKGQHHDKRLAHQEVQGPGSRFDPPSSILVVSEAKSNDTQHVVDVLDEENWVGIQWTKVKGMKRNRFTSEGIIDV